MCRRVGSAMAFSMRSTSCSDLLTARSMRLPMIAVKTEAVKTIACNAARQTRAEIGDLSCQRHAIRVVRVPISKRWEFGPHEQIGRASCRERVEMEEVA